MPALRNLNQVLFSLAIVLVFAAAAVAQNTERRPADASIQIGTVTDKSPAVDLKAVSKEVAPGVFEVNPDSIRGKRLTVPRSNQTARFICIGKWKNGECKGIYIEW